MNNQKWYFAIILLVFTLFTVGCSGSVEKEIESTKQVLKTVFEATPQSPTEKNDDISYYVPSNMSIKEDLGNNIIFEKGTQTFILFVNTKESLDSHVLYDSIQNASSKGKLAITFDGSDRFGYGFIEEVEHHKYEVVVGIGGVKMTTITDRNSIKSSAELMMEIVNSVKY